MRRPTTFDSRGERVTDGTGKPSDDASAPITRGDLERLHDELPVLLSESRVGALYGVHPKTIDRWSRKGRFPAPLLIDGEGTRQVKRYGREQVLRHLAKYAGLAALALALAYGLLRVAASAGFEPARGALSFLTGSVVSCTGRHHHGHHVYALRSSSDPRLAARRRGRRGRGRMRVFELDPAGLPPSRPRRGPTAQGRAPPA